MKWAKAAPTPNGVPGFTTAVGNAATTALVLKPLMRDPVGLSGGARGNSGKRGALWEGGGRVPFQLFPVAEVKVIVNVRCVSQGPAPWVPALTRPVAPRRPPPSCAGSPSVASQASHGDPVPGRGTAAGSSDRAAPASLTPCRTRRHVSDTRRPGDLLLETF